MAPETPPRSRCILLTGRLLKAVIRATFAASRRPPGNTGGSVVARYVSYVGISPETYFAALRHFTKFKDVVNGMEKAEVFGFVVVLVCCDIGLNTRGGPREIGASVTRGVVVSLILILVLDYFVTKVLQ